MAEWLRRLTRKPKVRTAVGSSPTLDSLVAVRYTSPGRPEPCEGNLVAVAGSCGGVMVKHPWPLLEISLSDFRGLATLNINTYLPTYLFTTIINLIGTSTFPTTHVQASQFTDIRLFPSNSPAIICLCRVSKNCYKIATFLPSFSFKK